jgi:hypothetical protein
MVGNLRQGLRAEPRLVPKRGNFLGTVGELVAPIGWEGFATTAELLAIDRTDAALKRGR